MMQLAPRPVCVHHGTSLPFRFFGRSAELGVLDRALDGGPASVVALVGPGGEGKTAIVQHWLTPFGAGKRRADGVFLWSFYRGKDADLFLRELYAYAAGLPQAPEVSATYCVDHVLPVLRRERWVLVLDGAEVAQHETGPWFGRFVHPELGRLLEELAGASMPGVAVLTTRFPLPELELRRHADIIALGGLDSVSARGLLACLGVDGNDAELDDAAKSCGHHAKAVELLGTYLVHYCHGQAGRCRELPETAPPPGACDEEQKVARVLAAYQTRLAAEAQDIIGLATAFRDPPGEPRLLEYLASQQARTLLHRTWGRTYTAFGDRPTGWLRAQLQELIDVRLLERIGPVLSPHPVTPSPAHAVIDAHPLVRRSFEHVLGVAGRRQSAQARAGFLRGRPDRRRPATLEQAREEIELFHAHCDAGLWNEADGALVALDNPKHRFLAPALERDLLLRFFPDGDWRRPPLWSGFGRYRSLAICFELLGQFDEALAAYRVTDAPLRGDALLALGRLEPLLARAQAAHPWNALWQAYRAHALCLAGRTAEAAALVRSLVPVDVYEWLHVFECLLRIGQLAAVDVRSLLYRLPHAAEQRWSDLARQRMRADYLRVQTASPPDDLGAVYETLVEAYDQSGLPYERAVTRLGYAGWLLARGDPDRAGQVNNVTLALAARHGMPIVAADAWYLAAAVDRMRGDVDRSSRAAREVAQLRDRVGYLGPIRP
jgi:tetratricopeptide (TPR) repeat protein